MPFDMVITRHCSQCRCFICFKNFVTAKINHLHGFYYCWFTCVIIMVMVLIIMMMLMRMILCHHYYYQTNFHYFCYCYCEAFNSLTLVMPWNLVGGLYREPWNHSGKPLNKSKKTNKQSCEELMKFLILWDPGNKRQEHVMNKEDRTYLKKCEETLNVL